MDGGQLQATTTLNALLYNDDSRRKSVEMEGTASAFPEDPV